MDRNYQQSCVYAGAMTHTNAPTRNGFVLCNETAIASSGSGGDSTGGTGSTGGSSTNGTSGSGDSGAATSGISSMLVGGLVSFFVLLNAL